MSASHPLGIVIRLFVVQIIRRVCPSYWRIVVSRSITRPGWHTYGSYTLLQLHLAPFRKGLNAVLCTSTLRPPIVVIFSFVKPMLKSSLELCRSRIIFASRYPMVAVYRTIVLTSVNLNLHQIKLFLPHLGHSLGKLFCAACPNNRTVSNDKSYTIHTIKTWSAFCEPLFVLFCLSFAHSHRPSHTETLF